MPKKKEEHNDSADHPRHEYVLIPSCPTHSDAHIFTPLDRLGRTPTGTQPDLPSVLFNSHYDVVPCDMKLWHYDPFAAIINEEEEIVARGTQDMKCVWYV